MPAEPAGAPNISDVVTTVIADAVATVTVHRPSALNALNSQVLRELLAAFRGLANNQAVRAIVLTGGGRAFIAGADISEFEGISPAAALAIVRTIREVTAAIAGAPQPVIAAIQGYCLGGGLELALACDLRIATADSVLGLPEIKLGIIPGGGGTVRLTQAIGSSLARYMAMTGEPVTAGRALDIGLVHEVHAPDDFVAAIARLARRMAAMPPFAIDQLKTVLTISAAGGSTETALEAEIKAMALCFSTTDQKEGVAAFLTKRRPNFTGS